MTYLDFPRFHFVGRYFADPSTINNNAGNYKSANEPFDRIQTWTPGPLGQWNPPGGHVFRFEGVSITSAFGATGAAVAPPDPILNCTLTTPSRGRLVDLDPDQQLVSMLFGLRVTLVGGGTSGIAVSGDFEPAPFTDLWRRALSGSGDEAASAMYQSIVTVRSWGDTSASEFLQELQQAASDNILSIKFNVDGYSMNRSSPQFRKGRIAGTVGPGNSRGPRHFVVGRQLGNEAHPIGGATPAFRPTTGVNYCPATVDATTGTIQLDLGNALSASEAGGDVADIGVLSVGCRMADDSIAVIDTVDYLGADYVRTAGIVRVPRQRAMTESEQQLVSTSRLVLVAQRAGQQRRIVSEEVDGHVRADAFVARMNPGDEVVMRFHATRRGRPAASARVRLVLLGPPNAEIPVHGLTFPSTVVCDADGVAEATLRASDPGSPRAFYTSFFENPRVTVDGQVYRVAYALDGQPQHNPSNFLSVLVWNTFVPDEPPTWFGSMRQVFRQYGDLYPVMTNSVALDLAVYDQVVEQRDAILAVVQLPIEDPAYMPVTRDLSRSRRDAIVRFLTELGPDGKPLLGEEPAPVLAEPVPLAAARVPEEVRDIELGGKTIAGMGTPTYVID
jgi:hypothetical protein